MHSSQSNHEPYPWDIPDDEEGTPANDEENHREALQPSSLQAHPQPSTPATVQPSASERRFDVVRYENAWDKVPKSSRSTWPAIVKATKSRVDAALQSIDVEDPGDVSLSNIDVSPERLASRLKNEDLKKAGPAVSFCRYLPGTGRKAENVEAVAAYVIDLDGVDDERESRVLSGLTGIACCAYTTWGSGWKKPGKSWRIIIPLATDVPGGALWKPVWALLNERLAQGLNDPTTKDACRLHFLPRAPAKVWFDGERVENGDVEWLEQSGAFFDPTPVIEEARRQLAEEARQAAERERERKAQRPQAAQPANRPDPMTRALAYLEKCGPAIQGSAGSLTAMSVVGTVVRGFELSANEAFSVLQPWNARCVPPWSEKELRHKIDDALTTPDPGGRPRGWFVNEDREPQTTQAPAVVAAPADDEWPEPMPLYPIPRAARFPVELLPPVVAKFCEDEAAAKAVAVEMVAIPALGVLAGAIGKAPRVKLGDDWTERACLWTVVIAPPGTAKSPAQGAVIKHLREAEQKRAQPLIEQRKAWEAERDRAAAIEAGWKRAAEKDTADGKPARQRPKEAEAPPPPPTWRMIADDHTKASLASLMAAGSRGITLCLDELADLLQNFSRGNQSGTDRPFYLSSYTGGSKNVDRVSSGEQHIADVYLNIIGGIQPKKARELFDVGGDGLFERFGLIAYPDENVIASRARTDGQARAGFGRLIEDIVTADWTGEVQLASGAEEAFCEFEEQHRRASLEWPEEQAGLYGKAPGLVGRLALVFHLAEHFAGPPTRQPGAVPRATMERVVRFLREYLQPTWARTVALLQSSPANVHALRIARRLHERRLESVRPGDISKLQWTGLKTADEVAPAFRLLVEAGWLIPPGEMPKAHGTGRPPKTHKVNPRIFDADCP